MASILAGASNFTISGGTFYVHQKNSTFDRLSAAVAHSALHNAPARTDESRCHPHTRTNVLDHLERWAQGICDEGASVFWLHGSAGAGKSAIMQSLAERCAAQGLALGSFFFSRSDPTRNTAEVLIPTLAYQLAQLFPGALDVLEPVMNYDPLILKKSLQVQLLSLFVRPLQHLVQLGAISDNPQSPRVFLIDGLDECDSPVQQQAIIQAAAAVCHEHDIPVKFLIASRPEQAISTSFRWYKGGNRVLGTISLSEDPNAAADIRLFFEAEFHKIRTLHPFNFMIPSEWPDFYDINRLVWKSSSHFVYASTAMRYIWSVKENPVRSLRAVLGLEVSRTLSPFPELDALYHHILGSAAHRDAVLQILAHCLFSCLRSLASVVCMVIECPTDDLPIYMADMTSLISFPQSASDLQQEVKLLHASLGDFLCDKSRSGPLYVAKEVYLASHLERFLELFGLESRKQCNWPDWFFYNSTGADRYRDLREQVLHTITVSGHLVTTQQVLSQYSLLVFHQCEKDFQHRSGFAEPDESSKFLLAIHSIKTADGVRLFRSFLDDFFDILEAYIREESRPLALATLPLIFVGYPAQGIRSIHYYHSHDTESYQLIASGVHTRSRRNVTVLDIISTADLASLLHSVNASPESLAVAAEAMLGYLINEVKLDFSPTHSVHKAWLQRRKPWKGTAMGAPRLAHIFYAQCVRSLKHLVEDCDCTPDDLYDTDDEPHYLQLQTLHMILGPKFRLLLNDRRRRRANHKLVVSLLDALLWVLPKASFSDKIVLYSRRTFPQSMYLCKPGLFRRVRRCLSQYNCRARNAKLEELGHRIEHGDVSALIEKSRMLYLDAQD